MGKYTPLGTYLKAQGQNAVTLTFADIERIIHDTLPHNARMYFTSWDNRTPGMQSAWRDVGWRTVMVDLENEKVKFQRSSGVLEG